MFTKEQLEVTYGFPFKEDAVAVLQSAGGDATLLNHRYIGTEHLLSVYLRFASPSLISSLQLDVTKVRFAALLAVGMGEERSRLTDPSVVNLTPRADKVIRLGVEVARELQDQVLEPNHIMLGILRDGEGIAVIGLLEGLGVDLDRAWESILETRLKDLADESLPPQ